MSSRDSPATRNCMPSARHSRSRVVAPGSTCQSPPRSLSTDAPLHWTHLRHRGSITSFSCDTRPVLRASTPRRSARPLLVHYGNRLGNVSDTSVSIARKFALTDFAWRNHDVDSAKDHARKRNVEFFVDSRQRNQARAPDFDSAIIWGGRSPRSPEHPSARSTSASSNRATSRTFPFAPSFPFWPRGAAGPRPASSCTERAPSHRGGRGRRTRPASKGQGRASLLGLPKFLTNAQHVELSSEHFQVPTAASAVVPGHLGEALS
jgi:hypothetical protein